LEIIQIALIKDTIISVNIKTQNNSTKQ